MSLKVLLAGAAIVMAAPVAAQEYYGQVFGGFSNLTDSNFSGTIGGSTQNVDTDFDDGFNFGFAIGRTFEAWSGNGYGLRGEIELSYSDNDVDGVDFSGNGAGAEANPGGDVTSTRLFANLIADFNTGSRFSPYIGAGLGIDFVDHDIVYGNNVTITGSDEALAAQLILGASYQLNDRTALFTDARYVRSFDVDSTRTSPAGTASVSDDLSRVNVNFGVRFQF
ncbi:outer membrane protein [Epibacterium ulvae]|uniref:Opacity protein n=1 Tax=Epibacterium ulvae TaxID=1156985 RepID=A0A1G5PYJ5_9RHOB|nr:outer membrane beta-barrel protein [Epibacterium ulvae]SCZ54261.1 Opacity protein [Epibacterium ulvae]